MKKSILLLTVLGLIACTKTQDRQIASIQSDLNEDSNLNTDIVGGTIVDSEDQIAKSTVLLFDVQKGSLCTGNVVAANLILTAAHCTQVYPKNILVVFSTKMPQSASELSSMNFRRVISGMTSASWPQLTQDQEKNWGDIALLRFDGKLPADYKAISLLKNKSQVSENTLVTLAGFGITDGIKHTQTTDLLETNVKVENANYSETEFLFDQRSGHGACHGDSGGPAFIKSKNKYILIGVTSRGENDPADTCLKSSVYTSVSAHLSWIKDAAKQLMSSTKIGTFIAQPGI